MKLNNQNYYSNNMYKADNLHKRKNLKTGAATKLREQDAAEIQLNKGISKPAQAISFGGLFDTGFKLVEFINDNEAAYNAIYSLFVAGILKPAAVLHMPGSEDKDKQMIATKNFLQAFIGSFLSLSIGGGMVKKAMDNIKNNLKLITYNIETQKLDVMPETSKKALEIAEDVIKKEKNTFSNKIKIGMKTASQQKGLSKVKTFFGVLNRGVKYEPAIDEILSKSKELTANIKDVHLDIFSKNPGFVKALKENALINAKSKTQIYDAFESFWKNSTGSATAVGKAMIASALLPSVLNLIFGKRNKIKEQEELKKQTSMLNSSKKFMDEKANFKPFNKVQNANDDKITFTGNMGSILDSAIAATTIGIEKGAMSSAGEFFTKALSRTKKPSARMADIESGLITAYWVQNTIRSKKIDPKQKFGFNLHTVLVTVVSSSFAFIIDWLLDPAINWRKNVYSEKINNIAAKAEEKYPQLTKMNASLFEKLPSAKEMNDKQIAQYTIKKELNQLLSNAKVQEALQNDRKQVVEDVIAKLNGIDIIKNNNPVDKELVERAIDNLSVGKELQQNISDLIKSEFGSMFNHKGIVKSLSDMFLDNKETISQNPEILKDTVDSLARNYGKKMSKFKSLTIFTLVVRFLVPVLMVPYSAKLKNKLVEITQKKKTEKAQKPAA